MRKIPTSLSCILFLVTPLFAGMVSAADQTKDDNRLRNGKGSTIQPDTSDNHHVYGRKIPASDIVLSRRVAIPPAAGPMISTLDAKTPKRKP
jgi:Las17-binding protein actin regulator